VAVVSDLFFVARIREVARLAGVPLVFRPLQTARSRRPWPRALGSWLLDLTGNFD